MEESEPLVGANQNELSRKLTARHIEMIAIGGTIGTGVFIGSGATIAQAGPLGALVGYSIVGLLVYTVMTSLGELATHYPISGSFSTYAGKYVDPAFNFALGWNYWFQWAVSFPSELSAAGIITTFWYPEFPTFIAPFVLLVSLVLLNLSGVEGFGETEYWLSFIKVASILMFISSGLLVDLGIFGREQLYFKYWEIEGAPFKNGIIGIFNVFLMAFFSFGGTEIVGITAGEAQNPKVTIPKAIKNTFWRILLFYIVSIFVMGLVIRNDDPSLLNAHRTNDITISPFTLVFEKAGLPIAAHFINAVVLSAVVSAGNSALFAASRTLMALAQEGKAPHIFQKLNRFGVPYYSILCTGLIGCVSFLGIFLGDGALFLWLISITGVSGILTWISIALIHLRFRKGLEFQGVPLESLAFIAPMYPYGPIIAILLGIMIIIGQGYAAFLQENGLLKLIVSCFGITLFFGLYISYKTFYNSKLIPLGEINFEM